MFQVDPLTPPSSPKSSYAPASPLQEKVKQVVNSTLLTPCDDFDINDLLPDWPDENLSPAGPDENVLSASEPAASKKSKRFSTHAATCTPTKASRKQPSPYEEQCEKLSSGFLIYDGKKCRTTHLADGSYSSVYHVESTSRLVPGIDNAALVLKCFHGRVGAGFKERHLDAYLHHATQNYKDIAALGLPVAPIYNIDRLLIDHVVVQQKITHPVNGLDGEHLRQAKLFFDRSVEHHIPMDLQYQNLRVEGGVVHLIDFLEEPEEIAVLLYKALQSWDKMFRAQKLSSEDRLARLQYLADTCVKNRKYLTETIYTLLYNRQPINA